MLLFGGPKTNNPPLSGRVIDFYRYSWLLSEGPGRGIGRAWIFSILLEEHTGISTLLQSDVLAPAVSEGDGHSAFSLVVGIRAGLSAVFIGDCVGRGE